MHHSRFMPIAYLSDITSDLLHAAPHPPPSCQSRSNAHPIKPSATRVPALMNPSLRLSSFLPLIPNNELYERTLPYSACRDEYRQEISMVEVDSARYAPTSIATLKNKSIERRNNPRPRCAFRR